MVPPNFELRRKSDQVVTPLTPPQAKNLSEGENRSVGGGDAVVEAVKIAGSEGRGLFGDFYRKVTCRQIHIPLESF